MRYYLSYPIPFFLVLPICVLTLTWAFFRLRGLIPGIVPRLGLIGATVSAGVVANVSGIPLGILITEVWAKLQENVYIMDSGDVLKMFTPLELISFSIHLGLLPSSLMAVGALSTRSWKQRALRAGLSGALCLLSICLLSEDRGLWIALGSFFGGLVSGLVVAAVAHVVELSLLGNNAWYIPRARSFRTVALLVLTFASAFGAWSLFFSSAPSQVRVRVGDWSEISFTLRHIMSDNFNAKGRQLFSSVNLDSSFVYAEFVSRLRLRSRDARTFLVPAARVDRWTFARHWQKGEGLSHLLETASENPALEVDAQGLQVQSNAPLEALFIATGTPWFLEIPFDADLHIVRNPVWSTFYHQKLESDVFTENGCEIVDFNNRLLISSAADGGGSILVDAYKPEVINRGKTVAMPFREDQLLAFKLLNLPPRGGMSAEPVRSVFMPNCAKFVPKLIARQARADRVMIRVRAGELRLGGKSFELRMDDEVVLESRGSPLEISNSGDAEISIYGLSALAHLNEQSLNNSIWTSTSEGMRATIASGVFAILATYFGWFLGRQQGGK